MKNKTYKSVIDEFRLRKVKGNFNRAHIATAEDAAKYARNFYFDDIEIYESMFIILLNRRNDTTGFAKISQGGISGTVVDIKIIANYAVSSLANSVILIHNHPSGNLMASNNDEIMTEKVKRALELLDVKLIDHIILTADSFTSIMT